jgi:hypothetical protein
LEEHSVFQIVKDTGGLVFLVSALGYSKPVTVFFVQQNWGEQVPQHDVYRATVWADDNESMSCERQEFHLCCVLTTRDG